MDVATLVVIALLVSAASLASYLLSHWSSIRSSNRGIGWATLGIGTTLLLAAAAIVVLTTGSIPAFRLSIDEPTEPVSRAAWPSAGTAGSERSPPQTTPEAPGATRSSPDQSRHFIADGHSTEGDTEPTKQLGTSAAMSSPDSRGAPMMASSSGPRVVFSEADPWAATSCVYAFNPYSSDPTRWTIDNGCGVAVGIVLASCPRTRAACDGSQFTSWDYQAGGMTLPAKAQRPVTLDEETRYGSEIRYVACAIDPSNDGCLTRVQTLSDLGHRSGKSLEALVGANSPIKVRPSTEP